MVRGAACCHFGRARRLGWARAQALRLEQAKGPSAAARPDLGICHTGNCTVGKLSHEKIPLGSCHLGKIH